MAEFVFAIIGALAYLYIGIKVLPMKVRLITFIYIISICAYSVILVISWLPLVIIFSVLTLIFAIVLKIFIG
ncbi:MAG: hypothetical protein J7K69_04945 [Thermotogae bacterium]|nr:hypothetical protein [Thermotogota bacterium]